MKKLFSLFIFFVFVNCVFAKAKLPNIRWVTNNRDPVFASPKAKVDGVLKSYLSTYPLTFRLYGPNSNATAFVGWNRLSCLSFGLVSMHPYSLNYIPELATHWAVMDDNRIVYYKLDPDVKWRDGKPVTADDYVFAYKMMLNKNIKAPFYHKYARERFEAVEKIDDYTLKVVGAYPSWRALYEFNLNPEPKHATRLDKNWVRRTNWEIPLCVGPYYISKTKRGRYIRLKRVENWWGDKKRYLKNRYNFSVIELKIIRDEKLAFEHFKKGNLSYYVPDSSIWAKETDFKAVKKGWIVKRKIFTKSPKARPGIYVNIKKGVVEDKNFRKALQHLLDFEKINKNLLYSSYVRLNSFFTGTQYENPNLKSYPYNPKKAKEYLKKAGWIKRGTDGILVNSSGERCSFVLTYGSQIWTKHLDIYREDLKKVGVEMKLRLVDGAKLLRDAAQKSFQSLVLRFSAGIYPAPEQIFHSDYAEKTNTNNLFSYGTRRMDKLLEIYQKNLNFKKRLKAVYEIEDIIKDEAFFIPFWTAPYYRVLYHNNLCHIKDYEPLYTSGFNDHMTWWYDEEKDEELKEKKRKDEAIVGVNDTIEVDPYGLIKKEE